MHVLEAQLNRHRDEDDEREHREHAATGKTPRHQQLQYAINDKVSKWRDDEGKRCEDLDQRWGGDGAPVQACFRCGARGWRRPKTDRFSA